MRTISSRLAVEGITELVCLPVALASPRDRGVAAASKTKRRSPESSEQRLFVVERVLGHGWAVACDPEAIMTTGAEGNSLPARLTTEDCRRLIDALASRASFAFGRGRAVDVVALGSVRVAHYPFLLRYRRSRCGRLDFEAFDAITGRRAGGPLRAAIAAALIDADRELASP